MSIQNYLNQIKNAVFGKDVRESIHDAIKQCYDDAAVNHNNANMEVKLARGTHETLNDRITENEKNQENLSSQLDTKARELNNKINEVAEKGTTVEVVTNTTKTVIDEKINDGTIANMTIKKNSITADKLEFIDINENLLEGVSFIEGYYNPTTGAVEGKSSYKTTELMSFSSSILYTNVINNITYFDVDKAFIIGYWGGQYNI